MVIRVKKDKNYAVMSNYHFKDKTLSLRAKGLLSLMLSLSDDWDYSISGLCSLCQESRETIRKTLQELKNKNYLEMNECHDENGKFYYDYIIYENPKINP
jgi:response regulator of citrate/malate metabolism